MWLITPVGFFSLVRKPTDISAGIHPRRDDQGLVVAIQAPTAPSSQRAWKQPARTACVAPGGTLPVSLHRVRPRAWVDAPTTAAGWEALVGENAIAEPAFKVPRHLKPAAGVVVREPDGRIWLVCPTNRFSGYEITFPKGRSGGKCLQGTALCQAHEESGLRVRLIRHRADVRRSQTHTRYDQAERVGGSPADMVWESQAVMLVPLSELTSLASPGARGLSAPDLVVARAQGHPRPARTRGLS